MCSATEYLMDLATSQKQTLQIKPEMKNDDIQYLIIDQNGVCIASEEHADNTKEFHLLKLKIIDFWLLGDFSKRCSEVFGIKSAERP